MGHVLAVRDRDWQDEWIGEEMDSDWQDERIGEEMDSDGQDERIGREKGADLWPGNANGIRGYKQQAGGTDGKETTGKIENRE